MRRTVLASLAALLAAPASQAGLSAQSLDRAAVDRHVASAAPEALDLYRELLGFPNDAHRPEDVLALVGWLEAAFEERGFTTERLPTEGLPLLLAERRFTGGDGPTVLVYHQADGQPVDPAAWDQASPWEPVLKERGPEGAWRAIPWSRLEEELDPDWRVFARSTADMLLIYDGPPHLSGRPTLKFGSRGCWGPWRTPTAG